MNCVNCGHENLEKALICYWCGLDPITGKHPYAALEAPSISPGDELAVAGVSLPPVIEVPPPMPVPSVDAGMADMSVIDLTMPDIPTIEVAPPPAIPEIGEFTTVRRRRVRHYPSVRASPSRPVATQPVLPGLRRLLVFVVGLGILFLLGAALVTAIGAASFGSVFCLLGLFGLAAVLWMGLLLARVGRRIATRTGVAYERLETLGQILREVTPGAVKELPVNLPVSLDVLDLPVAYSELRSLAAQEAESPTELAVDLLTGAIASLVGRDDVVLAQRTYPVQTRGLLTRPSSQDVNLPVLTRRRAYVGPGELEEQVIQALRTDRPITIDELMHTLVEPGGQRRARHIVAWVDQALSENPPDLDALASPDEALTELKRYREAMRQADPELYELLESEIRRWLGGAVQRSVPSSLLDLARYVPTTGAAQRSGSARKR